MSLSRHESPHARNRGLKPTATLHDRYAVQSESRLIGCRTPLSPLSPRRLHPLHRPAHESGLPQETCLGAWKVDKYAWRPNKYTWRVHKSAWKVDKFAWRPNKYTWKVHKSAWKANKYTWRSDKYDGKVPHASVPILRGRGRRPHPLHRPTRPQLEPSGCAPHPPRSWAMFRILRPCQYYFVGEGAIRSVDVFDYTRFINPPIITHQE